MPPLILVDQFLYIIHFYKFLNNNDLKFIYSLRNSDKNFIKIVYEPFAI